MPTFPTAAAALGAQTPKIRGKFEVQKDDGSWLDLSDLVAQDRIVNWPGLSASQEDAVGRQSVQAGTCALDNADGYFCGAPPTGISSWDRRACRLSAITGAGTLALGIFLINDMEVSSNSPNVTLTLVDKGIRLSGKTADRVRNGKSWYANRPIGWLVQKLLEQEFTKTEVDAFRTAGGILARYPIPLAANTRSGDGTNRAVSHAGTPPEWDGTAWREDGATTYGSPMLFVSDANAGTLRNTLVYAAGNVLWYWNPTTDVHTQIGDVSSLGAGYVITHLYWCADAGVRKIIGTAWIPDIPAATFSGTNTRDRSGAASGGQVRFFQATATTLTAYAAFSPPAGHQIYTGHFAVRAGGWTAGTETAVGSRGGSGGTAPGWGINIPVPFAQWLRQYTTSPGIGATFWSATGYAVPYATTVPSHAITHAALPGGWYAFAYSHGTFLDARPVDYSWNCGQHQGAFAMQRAGKYLAFVTIYTAFGGYAYRIFRLDCSSSTGSPTYQYFDSVGVAWVTAGGTTIDLVATCTAATLALQPYAMDFTYDDANLVVAGAGWQELAWSGGAPVANSVIGAIISYTFANLNTQSVAFDSSGAAGGNNWAGTALATSIPLGLRMHPSSQTLGWASFLNVADLTWRAGTYVTNGGTPAARFQNYRTSNGEPLGCAQDTIASRWYWLESGSNYVVSQQQADNATAATIEASGDPPVAADQSLLAGLVFDPTATTRAGAVVGALYGISGAGIGTQANPETQGVPLPAANYLWQFAPTLFDRIEVADFGGLDLTQSLDELLGIGDFIRGWDTLGNFYFDVRPASTTIVATLRAKGLMDETTVETMTIAAKPGFRERWNYVALAPSRAVLHPPSDPSAQFVERTSSTRQLPTGAYACGSKVTQGNTLTQDISLRCVQGGGPGTEDDGAIAYGQDGKIPDDLTADATRRIHKLRWAFVAFDRVIETQLLLAASSGTSIRVPLQAADDVTAIAAYGDTADLTDDATGLVTTYTITGKSDSAAGGYTDLTLSATITHSYPIGAKVSIHTYRTNRWSNGPAGIATLATAITASGATTLNGGISSTADTVVLNADPGCADNAVIQIGTEQIRIGSWNAGTKTGTLCEREYNGTTAASHSNGDAVTLCSLRLSSATHAPRGTVLRVQTAAAVEEVRVIAVLSDGQTCLFADASNTLWRGIGGTAAFAHSAGDVVQAFWAPVINAVWPAGMLFPIGGTTVALGLTPPPRDGSNVVQEQGFWIGDRIDVTCPGLSLETQDQSKIIAVDQASIDRSEKKEWKAGTGTKFLTFAQAREAAQRIVADYGGAHFLVTASGKCTTLPTLGETYLVRDDFALPWTTAANPNGNASPVSPDTAQAIAASVRGYTLNPLTDSLTLTLRALNPHAW